MERLTLAQALAGYPDMGEEQWERVQAAVAQFQADRWWIQTEEGVPTALNCVRALGGGQIVVGALAFLAAGPGALVIPALLTASNVGAGGYVLWTTYAHPERFEPQTDEEIMEGLRAHVREDRTFYYKYSRDLKLLKPVLPNIYRGQLLGLRTREEFDNFERHHWFELEDMPETVQKAFHADKERAGPPAKRNSY